MSRPVPTTAAIGLALFNLALFSPGPTNIAQAASPEETRSLARDVYQYAFPIVLMDITREQTTAVADATSMKGRAPMNQFGNFRSYPDAGAREVVRFNFDTLYSAAWVDLSSGPMILSVPDTGGRFYLVPALDMWTDVFASIGSRTTGTEAGNFAYVPPGWSGQLPDGVERIDAPTPMIWLLGRVQTNGPADYDNVHKIQDGLKLTPLDRWGKQDTPPTPSDVDTTIDRETPPLMQIENMTGVALLSRFAGLLKKYPPHPNDYPILFRMRKLGLEPGKDWDAAKLDKAATDAINTGAEDGLKDMAAGIKQMGTHTNGWNVSLDNVGTYGTSYRRRAMIALGGLGANLPEDAIYPVAFVDSDGRPLTGGRKYLLHFPKGKTPPADAFWSLTMYDGKGFQVENPLNRFAIGDRDKLTFNKDGSLDIYIQPKSPGKNREANWLPSPDADPIGPTLRIYGPRTEAFDGRWVPPAIRRID